MALAPLDKARGLWMGCGTGCHKTSHAWGVGLHHIPHSVTNTRTAWMIGVGECQGLWVSRLVRKGVT